MSSFVRLTLSQPAVLTRCALTQPSRLPRFIPTHTSHSRQSSSQPEPAPPNNAPSRPNAYKSYYKGFGRPVALNLLVAMATFQVLYWSWLKLESIEERHNKAEELKTLERDLKGLIGRQTAD